MRNKMIVSLLVGLLAGALGGFIARSLLGHPVAPAGTAVLNDLSFDKFAANTGLSEWKMLEDRVYDRYPPSSIVPRLARRIVAQSTLPDAEQLDFDKRFQNAAEEWLRSHGAVIKGQYNAERNSTEVVGDGQRAALLDLPRRFYALDNIHGVADFWWLADSGRVTVIICVEEAP